MGRSFLIVGATSEEFASFTNGFADENLIGEFQFGRVYRGVYEGEPVMVKVWDNKGKYRVLPGENEFRLHDEFELQKHFRYHAAEHPPCLAYMIACCGNRGYGKYLGAVYDVDPLDTLHNLIEKDSFTWSKRIKVAYKFASLLKFMQTRNSSRLQFLIRNVDAAHIMLDQDYNPVLFDLSMISGGVLFDRRELINQRVVGCHGYADPICTQQGRWSVKCDIYSFGVLLLRLITKRLPVAEDSADKTPSICEWAKMAYQLKTSYSRSSNALRPSLVDGSLESGQLFSFTDAVKITELAMLCIEDDPQKRPDVNQVVLELQHLKVLRFKTANLGSSKLVQNELANYDVLDNRARREVRDVHNTVEAFSFDDLRRFTQDFNAESLIGSFQFGKVYRGKVGDRSVTVKIWEGPYRYYVTHFENAYRLRDELLLLQDAKLISHPNLVKLIGYYYEEVNGGERVGIVYDLESQDSVYNLIRKGSLTWLQRIKVAFKFASLLEFLHADNPPHEPYIVHNIDIAHIMLDEDFNPKLIDFGLFSGGILSDRKFRPLRVLGCHGYTDVFPFGDYWETIDVYGYGIVLLNLISGRVSVDENITLLDDWAMEEYEAEMSKSGSAGDSFSLVHQSLKGEVGFYEDDGHELTMLALKCVDHSPGLRPEMGEVVKRLLELRVVAEHPGAVGLNLK